MVIMTELETVGQKSRDARYLTRLLGAKWLLPHSVKVDNYKSDWHFMHIPIIHLHDLYNSVFKKITVIYKRTTGNNYVYFMERI
jgi:hypothetical protein